MRRALLFVSLALLAGWSALAAQTTCQTHSGLTYATWQDAAGQTQELKLELLVPQSASPVPVVVWIHGGGWFNGSRLPIPTDVSALCSRGYAVASVDYRLSDTALWPAQIQDVKGAVRWLRARAATYNLDPDRFAAWGSSAGAHLASMLGTTGDQGAVTVGNETVDLEGTTGGNASYSSRVQAVVSWYGYGDFLQMNFYPSTQNHDTNGSPESRLVGDWIQRVPERVATASPLTFASPDDPPFLVMHGTLDDLVPFNQSELLVDSLRRNGVQVSWVPVPNGGHGNSAFNTPASYQTVYTFLAGALLNLPAVTVGVQATDAAASEAGAETATFLVSRTGSTASALTVHWAPGGTARIGADYSLAAPWSVTIPAGASSASLTVRPVDDPLVEGDETVVLKLASVSGAGGYRIDDAGASAIAILVDDDARPDLPVVTLAAPDPIATEIGPQGGTFTIAVEPPPSSGLAVRYSVSGTAGSATNSEDYAALSGEVIVPAGVASVEIDLTVLTDSRMEPSETVILTLEPSPLYEVGSQSAASVQIREADDESTLPIVSVSATDPRGSEPGADDGSFTVTRTGNTDASLTLDLAVGGAARENVDYSNIPGTVFFGKGVSRISIVLEVRDDILVEGEEAAALAVVPAPAFLTGPYAGSVVMIADDEPSPGPGGFYLVSPCRLATTRGPAGAWGAPRMASGEIRVFEAAERCGIPADATALAVNLTVIDPASQGHATLFETGAPKPTVSSINFQAGQNKANNAIVPLTGNPRSLAVYCGAVTGGCDVILDVTGYFR